RAIRSQGIARPRPASVAWSPPAATSELRGPPRSRPPDVPPVIRDIGSDVASFEPATGESSRGHARLLRRRPHQLRAACGAAILAGPHATATFSRAGAQLVGALHALLRGLQGAEVARHDLEFLPRAQLAQSVFELR